MNQTLRKIRILKYTAITLLIILTIYLYIEKGKENENFEKAHKSYEYVFNEEIQQYHINFENIQFVFDSMKMVNDMNKLVELHYINLMVQKDLLSGLEQSKILSEKYDNYSAFSEQYFESYLKNSELNKFPEEPEGLKQQRIILDNAERYYSLSLFLTIIFLIIFVLYDIARIFSPD